MNHVGDQHLKQMLCVHISSLLKSTIFFSFIIWSSGKLQLPNVYRIYPLRPKFKIKPAQLVNSKFMLEHTGKHETHGSRQIISWNYSYSFQLREDIKDKRSCFFNIILVHFVKVDMTILKHGCTRGTYIPTLFSDAVTISLDKPL
jgi:hypothetical protein